MAARARRRINEDHDCQWRERVEGAEQRVELAEKRAEQAEAAVADLKKSVDEQLALMRAETDSLKRRLLGSKTEKLPPIGHEVREKVGPDPAAAQEARRANAMLRSARVVTERIDHKIPDGERMRP